MALGVVVFRYGFFGAGDYGESRFLREFPRSRLIAQQVQQIRAGADEGDAHDFAGARQRRIFGKKTVAGMNGVDAALLG